jgi:hypothetical protein
VEVNPVTIDIDENVRSLALKTAQALDNPKTWCRAVFALNARGYEVSCEDPTAVKWCALGHAYRIGGRTDALDLVEAYQSLFNTDVESDNDKRGREYVRNRLLELANS